MYQCHVRRYAERGARPVERFVLMMKNDGISSFRAVYKPKRTSEKQFRCADAPWWLGNDSQSSPAPLKKPCSKSNNEYREKAGPEKVWAHDEK